MTTTATPPTASPSVPVPGYLAHTPPDRVPIQQWVDQFNRDGYLVLKNVLTPDMVARLREDLERGLREHEDNGSGVVQLRCRMFECSDANVRLFDLEPIVTFAEKAVSPDCHVVHNNSFITPPGGGITGWHQDDGPHLIVTHGEPPTNIMMPCLLFTANYYLSDVDTVEHGPTQVVPGSHLFGVPVPQAKGDQHALAGTPWEDKIVSCLAPAGSVVIFNNQIWHRGGPNSTDRTRYMTQVSYARRLVGHKYFPFMNYQMPERLFKNAGPRLKRLLGFLPSGAYG